MLNELRIKVEKMLVATNNNPKYQIIKKLLQNEQIFFMISKETSISILNDLGYQNLEADIMYQKLISSEEYEKSKIYIKE